MSPGDECITHSTIHKSLIFISMTLTGGIFILAWPSILQVGQKKKKRERESRTNNTAFLVCFGFVTGWLSVLLLLLQDAVTETHKGTHSGTRHSHIPAVVSQKRKQERVLAHTQTHTATHSRLDVTA